jgi:nucleoside-diphosphate-sugar epimerase
MPQKILDSRHIFYMGWKPTVNLDEGLKKTYAYYLNINNKK